MATRGAEYGRGQLDRALNGALLGLAVQFLLGMWLNIYGTSSAPSTFAGAITDGGEPLLILHIVLGIFLFLGGIGILVLSLRDPLRSLRWFAIVGLLAIVVAGFSGSDFVYSSYTSGAASYLMAAGLLVAVTAYYEGLVQLRSHPIRAPA